MFRSRVITTRIGDSRVLPKTSEARRPLRVFNANRPVCCEVIIQITNTSKNTVDMVYQKFEPFAKFKYSTLH